jgi:fatty acid amide hydrolase 2
MSTNDDPRGELSLLSGTALARLVRAREVSSREVVLYHVARIRETTPRLNAVVAERFGEALAEADAADRALSLRPNDERPPFFGVPFTVKECFALTGMPNTAGLVARRGLRATSDATVVRRVRAAGAIPLGVTNTSELCMWMESNNYVYGCSRNPYDPTRTVGGSSGGEAAIVGAGASPFGIGSDIGGSIRGPAFYCGVFGHKPTGGLVPGSGQYPVPSVRARRYLTTGPITRRAEDLAPLLRLMAGPDGEDPGCLPLTLGDPAGASIRGMRVLRVEDEGAPRASAELRRAQEAALRALEARGATIVDARFPALRHRFEIWSAMLGEAQELSFGAMLGRGAPIAAGRELAKWALGRSEHTLMATLLAAVDQVTHAFPRLVRRYIELGRALREDLIAALGPSGVMLYPSSDEVAPRHDDPVRGALHLRFPTGYLGVMNVLELPSTQVPLGLGAEGLPLGVQVIGPTAADHRTIAVALALEEDFGGWVPPRVS